MAYIKELASFEGQEVTLKGWVANRRDSKGIVFIILRDGSGFVQCVINENDVTNDEFEQAKRATLETSIILNGKVVKDDRQLGGVELQVNKVQIITVAEEYPLGKKEHGPDFLMDHRHLWLRSKRQWAIMRVRNRIIFAIHSFFQNKGFVQMDAPIFTGNACEGTTELFQTDFYGDPAYLSQSGQLYGEAMAMAQGLIYTFGPTFRAEKSKTRRHLSEFWMIEPEMAFYDLEMDMNLIEEFVRYVVLDVIEHCKVEMETLERDTTMLETVKQPFPRITHAEAVTILRGEKAINGKTSIQMLEESIQQAKNDGEAVKKEIAEREERIASGTLKKGEINFNQAAIDKLKNKLKDIEAQLENMPQWLESARNFPADSDFGGSDETVLTRLFGTPIMVYNWPAEIKAFYMKQDEKNPGLAKGVDLLAPEGYGEIVGGGERETNIERLIQQINKHELPMEAFEWYLDLRRFGSVPHAGFGLGLERVVSWICKLDHIRETIPFARSYGRLMP
jgi:asparaginyl-tRNA synthetase